MATQTTTRRQAAAKKAAATRQRNAAKRSAAATKSSARRTGSSAKSTSRAAKTTAKQATRTAERRADAAASTVDAVGRQAERALLIQIGAALEARDAFVKAAQTYTDALKRTRQLDHLERRGATALKRSRREIRHEARSAQREVGRQTNALKADAEEAVERLRRLSP
jgi:hypothetical protein